MSNLSLERLLFDPSDADGSPNLGVYLRAGNDGDQLTSTLIGSKEALDVNLVGSSESGIYEEDSAHSDTDPGQFILAVANHTEGALHSDDGDYAALQVDDKGRLRIIGDLDLTGDLVGDDEVDTEDPLKVGSHAYDQESVWGSVSAGDKANLASDEYRRILINDAPNVGVLSSALSVTDTEVAVPAGASALAGRVRTFIQNNGSDPIFVGGTGLSTATGLEIPKGATLSLEMGQAVPMYAIAPATKTVDARILQLA